jgi:multidrug efflux pump subunit AcrB
MIMGIVAENAIFVLHQVKILQGERIVLDEALVRTGSVRTRPIQMTTLAAVLALLPLALGFSAGAQMQQPVAIAVIGGFSVSSIILFFRSSIDPQTIAAVAPQHGNRKGEQRQAIRIAIE